MGKEIKEATISKANDKAFIGIIAASAVLVVGLGGYQVGKHFNWWGFDKYEEGDLLEETISAFQTSITYTVPVNNQTGYSKHKVDDTFEDVAEDLREDIIEMHYEFNNKYDSKNTKDGVYALNNAAVGARFEIDESVYEILKMSETLYADTEGYFDVTQGKLITLWDGVINGGRGSALPDQSEVDAAKNPGTTFADSITLEVIGDDHYATRHHANVNIDLGAIGKAFATEMIKEELLEEYETFFINSGASSMTQEGDLPFDWKTIGMTNPVYQDQRNANDPFCGFFTACPETYDDLNYASFGRVQVKGFSLGTSSEYDPTKHFFLGGKRYHHIINPKTGWPAGSVDGEDNFRLTSVLHHNAAYADAWSTAALIMPKDVLDRLAATNGFGYIGFEAHDDIVSNPMWDARWEARA